MTDLEHHHHPETTNELRQALHEIEAWEADQKDLGSGKS